MDNNSWSLRGGRNLSEPIPFSDVAQPIQLADDDSNIPFHQQGVLSGWGVNETGGGVSPYLQKIYLQLLTDEECTTKINNYSGHTSFISTHDFCSDDYYNGECYFSEPIPFSDVAQPIQLAEDDSNIPFHQQGVLSGWGVNGTSVLASKYLQKIYLQLLTDEECTTKINNYSGGTSLISIHDFCSDDYYNGECSGDSGSPFVINGLAYGVVSWSFKPCGIVPGTYSRITNPEYRNWIRSITNI